MFEGYTLEQQQALQEARGWKPGYSALTYCTAEAVVFRGSALIFDDPLSAEVVVAQRISGAPDCLGKLQSKWGGYTKPIHQSPDHAIRSTLKDTFDWNPEEIELQLSGIIGPWLYQGTIGADEERMVLTVSDSQAEATPFQATLYAAIVSDRCKLGRGGSHLKSTTEARWIALRDLIATEGSNPNHMYWQMVFHCFQTLVEIDCRPSSLFRAPGQYALAF